jgi:polyhydroxybutyrate depolymerase
MKPRHFVIAILALLTGLAISRADAPQVLQWTIDGRQRAAIVMAPPHPASKPAPVLFFFHGHGGSMRLAARYEFQRYWPEAIVVYPQGLPTATPQDPQGRRAGWQLRQGAGDDRDLKFFDAILATLRRRYDVDDKRICVAGHSNGGVFTYLLWAERGSELAAIAASSAPALIFLGDTSRLKPLPVLHLAGENDTIVPFAHQQRSMQAVRDRLGCDAPGKPWDSTGELTGTIYASNKGTPFVSLIHPGGHVFPAAAVPLIIRFFQQQAG